MSPNRKIIALDIGGVCVSLRFEKCFEALDIENGSARMSAFLDNCKSLGNGEIDESLWLERSSSILDGRFSKKSIQKAWELVLGPVIPGMTEFIQSLSDYGYEFAFLSDTSTVHMARFRSLYGLWELSAGGVFSYEVGKHKPDQSMYRAFEERFGTPLLYVDDLQTNIDAALSRGWSCKLFNNDLGIREILNMRY